MPTDIEIAMAKMLTQLGYRYYEQYELPPYIVDFYIPEFAIVVEADGDVWHAYRRDRERDIALMKKYRVRVMHFNDETIKKRPESIIKVIQEEIDRTGYYEYGEKE
jgi:very-short-patch-repair endonuclease